jgi:hypothetical protein
MAIIGALGMTSTVTLAGATLPAVPLSWTAGTATVDGNTSDWNLSTDASTRMCEAGWINTDGTCNGKEQLSTLYTRYDCNTNTMYVLVLKADGHTADNSASWVKVYSLGNSPRVTGPSNSANFHDVTIGGVVQGYEASFTLAAGTYNDAEMHLEVDGSRTSSTGKVQYTRSMVVPENCTMPPTSGAIGGYSGFTSWGQCQSGGTTLSVVGRLLPTSGKSKVDYNDSSVTGEVYNNSNTPQTVTLVAYKEFYEHDNYADKTVNGVLIPGQRVHNYQTVSVPANGHVNLTAQLPGCSTQIDLVCGDVIQYLGSGLYNARKLAYYHAHQPSGWCNSTGVTPWNPPTNSGSTNPPAACTLKMDSVAGVTAGQAVEPGAVLNLQGMTSGGTPAQVRFEVSGPNGAVAGSPGIENVAPYYFMGDTNSQPNGWNTTGLPEGQYTAKASVYDANGKSTSTACDAKTVNFTLARACPFSMTTLTNVPTSIVAAGTVLNVGANVTGGTPSKVQFDVMDASGNVIQTVQGSTASINTSNYADGQYTVKVSVFGTSAAACQTQQASFSVRKPCSFDMTGLSGITDGSTVKTGTSLTIGANVTGTPTRVKFDVTGPNGTAVTSYEDSAAPYGLPSAVDTSSASEGQYVVTATALDRFDTACQVKTATVTIEPSCKFKMDNLTGVTDGQTVNWGDTLTLGANVTDGIPAKVKFELTGPEGEVISSSDNASAPYSVLDTLDTSKSGAGAYTLKVSASDRFDTACATKQVSFNVVKPEWATSFRGDVYENDFCSLSQAMAASGNLSAMALPQWVEVPAWIETYDAVNQTPQGGLKVKVSSAWSVAHPSTTDAAEQEAAGAVVCPEEMTSDTCNAGQVHNGEDQVMTSGDSGRIEFTVKVWWPGITSNYVELLAAHQNGETLIADNTVESAYQVMVSGGQTGDEAINDRETGKAEFEGNISWNPMMVTVNVLKAGSEEVISFDGCVLTGVDLETR